MRDSNSIIMDIADKHPNIILQITAGDLCDFAHQLIESAMEIVKQQSKHANDNVLLTIDEVAAMLKVSKMTLWRWDKEGLLSKVDMGGARRYRRSEVEALVANRCANQKSR